jgi:hypothetical protein
MEEEFDETTMHACLIAAGQRAEHYEMAAYGTLVAWAKAMGHTDAANLLQQTLDEEKAADKKLSGLAEGGINQVRLTRRTLRMARNRLALPAVRQRARRRAVAGKGVCRGRVRWPPTQLTMKPPNKRNRKMIAAAISRNTRPTILTRQPARGNPGPRDSAGGLAHGVSSTS